MSLASVSVTPAEVLSFLAAPSRQFHRTGQAETLPETAAAGAVVFIPQRVSVHPQPLACPLFPLWKPSVFFVWDGGGGVCFVSKFICVFF